MSEVIRRPAPAAICRGQAKHVWTVPTYLSAFGLDPEVVNARAGWLGIVHATVEGGRFWWDWDGGEESAVIQALDEMGDVLDYVAWPLASPERFGRAYGAALVLGPADLHNPARWAFGQVLRIHKTPLAWLREGDEGVCLLDYRYGPVLLRQALGDLLCQDDDHALLIHDLVNPPSFPHRVLSPEPTS
jgi:hypothetical protein